MKPADEIRRLIHESQIAAGPGADERMLRGALDELEERRRRATAHPEPALWRIIMTSRTTKIAAAAGITIAALIAFHFIGNPVGSTLTFAQVIQPILRASTAEFDIIVGKEDGGAPIIHDMVMGSRIRRTVPAVGDDVTIIDLEAGRILTFSETKEEAQYISLEGLPPIPNYMDHLKNVLLMLDKSPDFVVEDLGVQEIDGREVVGFLAKHPRTGITLWADAETGLPVRIEQNEGQMRTICRNMQFDVEMDESLFSMDVPEGYTVRQETTLDLQAGTEEAFIEGLRLLAERFNDGRFPDGVAVEDYLKQAPDVAKKTEAMNLTSEEQVALGQTIQNYLLFTRFFQGEGEWTYQGQGVMLGQAETPIFWYRPKDSETYRVIYGDLHAEDVTPEDLPEPLPPVEGIGPSAGYHSWSRPGFVGSQETFYYVLPDARVRVEGWLTLLRGPQDASLLPIRLPHANALLESVRLGESGRPAQDSVALAFERTGDGTYNIALPLGRLSLGQTLLICQWHLPLDAFSLEQGKYWVDLQSLIPVVSYKVNVGVDPNSGFELTIPPANAWANPFTSAVVEKPTTNFGRCTLVIQKHR
jgi:hypothetical protein